MAIDEFLRSLGMDKGKEEQEHRWHEIVRPETVSIILGRKGFGKSALAYWLCDEMAKQHELLPVVVNLPRERQGLLPETFIIRGLEDVPRLSDSVIIIDEGTTMLPAGQRKLEEMVKGYVALSRQRNQIILFIFHSSADVGSRILRGVDTILLKKPSQRQIQHGAKDNWWRGLLTEAKEKFEALSDLGANPREFTFVDSEEPEFRGILQNPLPLFWSDGLSRAWAGIDNLLPTLFGVEEPAIEMPTYGTPQGWHADDPQKKRCHIVTPQMKREAIIIEPHIFDRSTGHIMEYPPKRIRWVDFRR